MFVIRNYVTTGGTVACALAIGYLMQYGPAAQSAASRSAGQTAVADSTMIAGLEDIVLTSASPVTGDTPTPDTARPAPAAPTATADCGLRARATTAPMASARVVVTAPCHPNQTVELLHSGMVFTGQTDQDGILDLTIPVLAEYAIFLISFDDKLGTVATTHVPEIAGFDRVALQWSGNTDLQLHALEFGASYGEAGHVWSNAEAQGTGRVNHYGAGDGRKVEIYSIPKDGNGTDGSVALTVEAEVTPENCGQELSMQSLELLSDQELRSRELSLVLPACDSGQDFLVLNNLFQDLTIASN